MMIATHLSAPSLSTFANKKPNNTERGHRVYPPCTDGKLHDESCYHDKGEPAAGYTLDCISPERAAAKRSARLSLRRERKNINRHSRRA